MILLIDEYRAFVDQHVLWIRSTDPLEKSHFQQLWPSLTWLLNLSSWKNVANALWGEFRSHLTEGIIVLLGWTVLLYNSVKLRRKIKELVISLNEAGNNTRYLPTIKVVLLTLLVSAPWPALFAYIGLRLYAAQGVESFVQQFGFGLAYASRFSSSSKYFGKCVEMVV